MPMVKNPPKKLSYKYLCLNFIHRKFCVVNVLKQNDFDPNMLLRNMPNKKACS